MPVPAGTTDYTQFILAAEDAGAEGIALAVGEQEGLQVVRAGQQLGTDLLIGSSLSTLGHSTAAELGDFADQVVFLHSFPPATYDLPVYEALRDDLSASGEESLQPENLQATAMRSWIGLYALLWMIRDTGMTEFTREGVSTMLDEATDVPMLGIFGGEDWTPSLNHPGVFQRAGTNHWAIWRWDPEADGAERARGELRRGRGDQLRRGLVRNPARRTGAVLIDGTVTGEAPPLAASSRGPGSARPAGPASARCSPASTAARTATTPGCRPTAPPPAAHRTEPPAPAAT